MNSGKSYTREGIEDRLHAIVQAAFANQFTPAYSVADLYAEPKLRTELRPHLQEFRETGVTLSRLALDSMAIEDVTQHCATEFGIKLNYDDPSDLLSPMEATIPEFVDYIAKKLKEQGRLIEKSQPVSGKQTKRQR